MPLLIKNAKNEMTVKGDCYQIRHVIDKQRNSQFGARVFTPDSSKFMVPDSEKDTSFYNQVYFFINNMLIS